MLTTLFGLGQAASSGTSCLRIYYNGGKPRVSVHFFNITNLRGRQCFGNSSHVFFSCVLESLLASSNLIHFFTNRSLNQSLTYFLMGFKVAIPVNPGYNLSRDHLSPFAYFAACVLLEESSPDHSVAKSQLPRWDTIQRTDDLD